MRLSNHLEHDFQHLDLKLLLGKAENLHPDSPVALLQKAQALEKEADDTMQKAQHLQAVHDWYYAAAASATNALGGVLFTALDVQLAEPQKKIADEFKIAAAKVMNPRSYSNDKKKLSHFKQVAL